MYTTSNEHVCKIQNGLQATLYKAHMIAKYEIVLYAYIFKYYENWVSLLKCNNAYEIFCHFLLIFIQINC